MGYSVPRQNAAGGLFRLPRQRQEEMFSGNKLVLELLGLLGGLVQDLFERRREIMVGGPAHLGESLDGPLRFRGNRRRRRSQPR